MSKRVNKSYIYIDGAKLKNLLESTTGKTLKEISLENGFSDSFLRMVIKTGKASPAAQAVARVYGIEPSAYEIKPVNVKYFDPFSKETETVNEDKQISFEDLNKISRDELKELVKEAIIETFNNMVCNEIESYYDPKTRVYTVALKVKKEA